MTGGLLGHPHLVQFGGGSGEFPGRGLQLYRKTILDAGALVLVFLAAGSAFGQGVLMGNGKVGPHPQESN